MFSVIEKPSLRTYLIILPENTFGDDLTNKSKLKYFEKRQQIERLPFISLVLERKQDNMADKRQDQFDDYGHMRFGKRGEDLDDYGHMRFGKRY
ncbi:drosulfakinins precursor, putative [Pediculus humanus corporis]|uniref:Drosulfakinins, putative n=1 Tax=Pediculus humanus subsp. corporis TaxID=121224 RepID=E0VF34_PEDHC|nr:drosulfakinins precursor, putative [Pediculus humanus corporis]EEB11923.1 drosulfakinins precursor, putative [Pediculus humanus corporis]